MKQQFITINFRQSRLDLIEECNAVAEQEYNDGAPCNLRQLYYRLVTKNIIENSQASYKNLSKLLTDARMAGLMDWNYIEDRDRTAYAHYPSGTVEEIIGTIDNQYSADRWRDQEYYLEVWIEKNALIRVLENAADPWYCTYMSCKGNLSTTEAYLASLRFKRQKQLGKRCVLLHCADHDPTGLDMTRDNSDRLFTLGADVEVKRIALNFDQVEHYDPPPNPVKETDSRSPDYIEQFGHDSWELDAIPPRDLTKLISDKIKEHIDLDIWQQVADDEEHAKRQLTWIADNHYEVLNFVDDRMEDYD